MPTITINPRQIFLDAISSNNFNGLFSGRNTASFTPGGNLTSIASLRTLVGPAITFGGINNALPLYSHRVVYNNGVGAHYVINSSDVSWVNGTTGAIIANSTYAGNVSSQAGNTNLTQYDWVKVVNPGVLDIPTSLSVDYMATATRYTSPYAPCELRNDIKTTDPIFSNVYSNPFVMGNVFAIPNTTISMRLLIKTVGVNNTLHYEVELRTQKNNQTTVNPSTYVVDVGTNTGVRRIISLLNIDESVYVKTTTPRTDVVRYNRVN